MTEGFLETIKTEITGKRIALTERMWMQSGGIQVSCIFAWGHNYMGTILIKIL